MFTCWWASLQVVSKVRFADMIFLFLVLAPVHVLPNIRPYAKSKEVDVLNNGVWNSSPIHLLFKEYMKELIMGAAFCILTFTNCCRLDRFAHGGRAFKLFQVDVCICNDGETHSNNAFWSSRGFRYLRLLVMFDFINFHFQAKKINRMDRRFGIFSSYAIDHWHARAAIV